MKRRWLIKDKGGQFYLIAAIIISVIVIGFISMSNYSRKQEQSSTIENFGEELKVESEKVLDFGTYNGYSSTQIRELMKNFSTDYITYLRDEKDSYFIFGDRTLIKIIGYSKTDRTIYVDTGSGQSTINIQAGQIFSQDFTPSSNDVIITIDGKNYEFELKSGENFYFALFEKIGEEEHVIRN